MELLQAQYASCPYIRHDTRYDISLYRSPRHRSPPHILLLRQWLFSSLTAHSMPSSIFPSPGHSSCTRKHMYLCFFCTPHTETSSYFHFISLELLTGRQHPLSHPRSHTTICIFLISGLTHDVYILLFSLIHPETIPPPFPAILMDYLYKSLLPHISVILYSKHSHSFLMNIPKPQKIHQLTQTKLLTNMVASCTPSRIISKLFQAYSRPI